RRRRRGVRTVSLLAGRQPRRRRSPGRGRGALRIVVRPSQPARVAARTDRPVDERLHRQLSAGVQPHWRHRQRGHTRQSTRGHGDNGMIDRLIIFGGTGDLTARYLLPGLAALSHTGHLPAEFELTSASREPWDTSAFPDWASTQLDRHAAVLPESARKRIVEASTYQQADVTQPESVADTIRGDRPVAAYLALPPGIFAPAIRALHDAGLPTGSTIVLEKPFSESLADAIELNELLSTVMPEDGVFRVDHFLALTTVQNILGTRMANRMLEPIWNGNHIAAVDIIWEESLGLEGRSGYYDGVGALKDMLQNH